jgi:hypothetical protein
MTKVPWAVSLLLVAGCADTPHDHREWPFQGESTSGNVCALTFGPEPGNGTPLELGWDEFEGLAPTIASSVNESLPAIGRWFTIETVTCAVLRGEEGDALLEAFEGNESTVPQEAEEGPNHYQYNYHVEDLSRGIDHVFRLAPVLIDPGRFNNAMES